MARSVRLATWRPHAPTLGLPSRPSAGGQGPVGKRSSTGFKFDGSEGHAGSYTRQLIALPDGGILIDTPGLRSLGLGGDVSLAETLSDIDQLAQSCRFADCQHAHEPDCAINLAAATGRLSAERLSSFRKLQREISAYGARRDPLARKAEQRVWKARSRWAKLNDKRKRD